MAADANAGHVGNDAPAVMNNPENVAPADRPTYDPKAVAGTVPGAAARRAGYPRLS